MPLDQKVHIHSPPSAHLRTSLMANRASCNWRLALGTRLASESEPESDGVVAIEVEEDIGLRFLVLPAGPAMMYSIRDRRMFLFYLSLSRLGPRETRGWIDCGGSRDGRWLGIEAEGQRDWRTGPRYR
jgi:hypothetical protein